MTQDTAIAVHYARYAIWYWRVRQPVGYETLCLNFAVGEGIVFG